MPCFQRLEWHDARFNDPSILASAVKAMGWSMNGNVIRTENGQVLTYDQASSRISTSAGGGELVNKLKIGYAQETLKLASQKFGFQKVQAGQNRYVFTKGV